MKWTIAAIAAENERAGGKYFSRGAMKFFKQRRSDFRVYEGPRGIFIGAPRRFGFSAAQFHPDTGELCTVPEVIYSYEHLKSYAKREI